MQLRKPEAASKLHVRAVRRCRLPHHPTHVDCEAWNGYDSAEHRPRVVTYVYAVRGTTTVQSERLPTNNNTRRRSQRSKDALGRTDLWPATVASVQTPRTPVQSPTIQ